MSEPEREPIAIVGIGCRLPGGIVGPEALWEALRSGLDAIGPIPRDRFDADALFSAGAPAPGRIGTRFGGFLDAIDGFDAAFFGIAPREAETLDPQQRLLLETAWEALEDAGTPPSSLAGGRAGVFVGLWLNDFEGRLFADPAVDFHATTGTGRYAASGRVSFALGLQGPSLTVDTACSSSLVAIHLACRSLWSGECPVALAGGANVILQPHITIAYSQSGMMAPDGRCKFGDARADGYVRSEGAGMVVLKPLARALADGDRVYAVIRGSAVNNDGRSGPYMATPSQAGQEQMLRLACEDAGVPPAEIDYVEAHGTGTGAGDPVEIGALGAVLGAGRPAGEKAALGSIKTNFGHTEGAAGVSGLIKSALVLHHGEIPASLHLREPNPSIPWSDLPVFVASEPRPLPERGRPRRAGVSSFGIAGTNAHVVLEEHAGATPSGAESVPPLAMLLPLSARSPGAAREMAARWADRLEAGLELRDAVHTAALRRDHLPERLAVVGSGPREAARVLRQRATDERDEAASGSARRIVFVFPGQGSQWPGMGTELLREEPVFRDALEACERAMSPWVDWSLNEQLMMRPDDPGYALDRIDVVQPALVSLDIAIAALWRSWGIEPDAVVGHSMGEVAAAAVAGALGLDDAMRVICVRSRLLRRISGRGAMAVVELDHDAAEAAIGEENGAVSVAAVNGPRTTILAGDPAAVDRVLARLEADGVFGRRVAVDVASHSAQVEPLADELREALRELRPRDASIPFHSTVEASAVPGRTLGADYWVRNLRRPVRLHEVVTRLAADGHDAFVEVSPHPVLLPAIQQSLGTDGGLTVGSLRRDEPERASMLAALGTIWEAGASVRWDRVNPEGRHASGPVYPWQKERHWAEPRAKRALHDGAGHPILAVAARSAAGAAILSGTLDLEEAGWLEDHRVRGGVVLPAAAILEMAIASRAGSHDVGVEIADVRFEETVSPGEQGTDLDLTVDPLLGSQGRWTLRQRDGEEWRLAATGTVGPLASASLRDAGRGPQIGPDDADAARHAEDLYTRLEDRGHGYGARFRVIRALRVEGPVAVAALESAGLAGPHGRFAVDPAILDGCLQTLLATLGAADPDTAHIPVAIERLRLHSVPVEGSRLIVRAERHDGPGLAGDFMAWDAEGTLLMEAERVAFSPLASRPLGEVLVQRWSALEPAGGASEDPPKGCLVLGDGGAFADDVVAAFLAAGIPARRIAGHAVGEALLPGGETGDEPPAVLDLRALDMLAGPGEDPAVMDDAGLDAALELVRAVVTAESGARVWLVTRGAQAAGPRGDVVAPAAAALWGLGAVAGSEHPGLPLTCVDLDPAAAPDAAALVRLLIAAPVPPRLAIRGGRALVPSLSAQELRTVESDREPAEPLRISPYRIVTRGAGSLANLVPEPMSRRAPGTGEVEIELRAAGLNFLNVMSAMGRYPGYPLGVGPLGIECVGRVTRVGEGVDGLAAGDRVAAFVREALASHSIADARLVVSLPDSMGWEAAATVPIAFLTASYALVHLGRIERGERVLIHSAAGGVGLAAIQIVRGAGGEVFATAGTPEKREHLRALGVEHVFDSRSAAFEDGILQATDGQGVDVVLNSLTGEAAMRSLRLLRPYGRFLELGKRDIHDGARLDLSAFRNQITYSAIDLDRASRDRPELIGGIMRDVMASVAAGELEPLPARSYPIDDVTGAFREMAGGRHIGKIVIHVSRSVAWSGPPPLFRPDASYLITGGTGALGTAVAGWMARSGAGRIVLVARGEPGLTAAAAIAEIRRSGVEVAAMQADVADSEAMAGVIAGASSHGRPLRGVFHAAGSLDDATLLESDAARIRRVLAPKLAGAWNLHRLTRDIELDHFVLFSSVSAVLGLAGQANYAAANAAMDALAHARRAEGLPALSVGWGPWSGIGLAAERADRGERLARQGLGGISPETALAALDAMLRADLPPHVVAARLDPARWARHHPRSAGLLEPLLRESRAGQPPGTRQGVREEFRAATSQPARRALMERVVRGHAAQVLRVPAERIPATQPLKALGMDSLMSLELRNRLESDLGVAVSATAIWNYPTIPQLAGHLATLISAAEPVALDGNGRGPATDADVDADVDTGEASGTVVLDREQIESMLDRELAAIDELLGDGR